MKLGIMQPYLFPYIGYFQLIQSVDKFVIHDDVQYIKGGWINRNRLLNRNTDCLFTLPISKDHSIKLINERLFIPTIDQEKTRLLHKLKMLYHQAPFFQPIIKLVETIFKDSERNLALFLTHQLRLVCDYLHISTPFAISSAIPKDNTLKGEARVIMINTVLHSTVYHNPIGGMEIYQKSHFLDQNLQLFFLKTQPLAYPQWGADFIPNLSILDVLMFNSVKQVKKLLECYDLI